METNLEKSPLKGQALIALAAAAGVVVASRLSRTGLALTAGLAWHFCSRRKASPAPAQAEHSEEAAAASIAPPAPLKATEVAALPTDLPSEAEPTQEPAVLLAVPAPIEDTHSPDWDDLRAALAPSLETLPGENSAGHAEAEQDAASAPVVPAGSFSPLTPILPEIHPFPPTDPWIQSSEPPPSPADETAVLPEPDQPDFLIDPEESSPTSAAASPPPHSVPGTTTWLPRPVQPPGIVARPESGSQPTPVPQSPGLMMPPAQDGADGEAGQPGGEEKKTFFDWLRS